MNCLPASLIQEAWDPLVDELTVSRLGSLHGLRCGKGTAPRPNILIATHMDAIGLMVNGIEDGLLRVTGIGGLDPRVLPGQLVTVHGREELPALIAPRWRACCQVLWQRARHLSNISWWTPDCCQTKCGAWYGWVTWSPLHNHRWIRRVRHCADIRWITALLWLP